MNAKVITFPAKTKDTYARSDYEMLLGLIQKYNKVKFKYMSMIKHVQSATSRLFGAAICNDGDLSKENRFKLMSYYNNPCLETWNEIKDIELYYHVTANDILMRFEDEIKPDTYPEFKDFYLYFQSMPTLLKVDYEKILISYNNEAKKLEEQHPGLTVYTVSNHLS